MPTFHFNNYELGTRCNLRLALEAQGFTRNLYRDTADFNEENLYLDKDALLHLERKDLLWRLLETQKINWMPRSVVLEESNKADCLRTLAQWKNDNPSLVWIVKPALLNNGTRIQLFDTFAALETFFYGKEYLRGPYVVQAYLTAPHLYLGGKYAYRVFVLVTNYAGCYLYPTGYANISKEPYQAGCWQQRKMHITNLMLDGVMTDILQVCTTNMQEFPSHFLQIQDIVSGVLRHFLHQFPQVTERRSKPAFELLGFDFSCDEQGKIWLLEVNHGPDCPRPIDNHPLYNPFWVPFWRSVAEEFVIPITQNKQVACHHWQLAL